MQGIYEKIIAWLADSCCINGVIGFNTINICDGGSGLFMLDASSRDDVCGVKSCEIKIDFRQLYALSQSEHDAKTADLAARAAERIAKAPLPDLGEGRLCEEIRVFAPKALRVRDTQLYPIIEYSTEIKICYLERK